MNRSRVVAVVLAVVAVSALATGTLGFSSVTAERSVSVNVVNSSQAYVGVTACAPTHGNGTNNGNDKTAGKGKSTGKADVYVMVTNQFSSPMVVEQIEGNGSDADLDKSSRVIGVGDVEKYPLQFDASEVTVEVGGNGFDATVTATVTDEQDRSDCNPSRP